MIKKLRLLIANDTAFTSLLHVNTFVMIFSSKIVYWNKESYTNTIISATFDNLLIQVRLWIIKGGGHYRSKHVLHRFSAVGDFANPSTESALLNIRFL